MLIVSLIILQLLIFAVLIFVFRKIMSQNVVSATKHLDELGQGYNEKEQRLNKELEEAKVKVQEMISKAQEEADQLKNQILQETEKEKDSIIKDARSHGEEIIQQAEKSRQQLLAELEERIEKEAINKACELIQDTLPEQFKQVVHAHWIEDLIENGFSQLERLRLPEDIKEAKVVSAFSLNDEQRKKLSKKLKDALGRDLALKEEVDPKVVAGIVITIGSLVLDGSFKNKIQEKAR